MVPRWAYRISVASETSADLAAPDAPSMEHKVLVAEIALSFCNFRALLSLRSLQNFGLPIMQDPRAI